MKVESRISVLMLPHKERLSHTFDLRLRNLCVLLHVSCQNTAVAIAIHTLISYSCHSIKRRWVIFDNVYEGLAVTVIALLLDPD